MNEEIYKILNSLKRQMESLSGRLARLESAGTAAHADDSDRDEVHEPENPYCEDCCGGLCGGCSYAGMV